MAPLSTGEHPDGTPLSRMSLDKMFASDLAGTSKGEMRTAATPVQGSAGDVAIEHLSGTLHGRAGTFVLEGSACDALLASQPSGLGDVHRKVGDVRPDA